MGVKLPKLIHQIKQEHGSPVCSRLTSLEVVLDGILAERTRSPHLQTPAHAHTKKETAKGQEEAQRRGSEKSSPSSLEAKQTSDLIIIF